MATRNAIARLRREAGLSQYRLAVMVGEQTKGDKAMLYVK